jgi:septal ring factor EnvC (AmiA/AmiB activator)
MVWYRRVTAAIALAATAALAPGAAIADHVGDRAEQAAREIQAARDRANEAAQAAFDAESRVDQLAVEIDATEERVAQLEAEVSGLRADMADAAVRRFVRAGGNDIALLSDAPSFADDDSAAVLHAAAIGNAAIATDDFDASLEQLAAQRSVLDQQRADQEQHRAEFEELKTRAEDEIVRLAEVERGRVADAEVQHELERQRRERLEREAQAAAAAAAAAAAQASERAAAEAARVAAAPAPAVGSPRPAGSSASPAPAPQSRSAPAAQDVSPAPVVAPPVGPSTAMVCPVAGPTAYADTWGAPRSGGRSHQGVDMMSARGTPLVAVEDGMVLFKTNALGGNVIWLSGGSGARYYYAHLSAWEGSSRSVSRGEVIGYVGATGNTTANHLHFEVHPNGFAVNPYPYVRAVC